MSNNVTYQVNLRVVGEDIIGSVTRELEQLEQTTQRTTRIPRENRKNKPYTKTIPQRLDEQNGRFKKME